MSVLKDPTLVLNCHWQPIAFATVRTSIVMVMKGNALAMDPETYSLLQFEDWIKSAPQCARWIMTPSLSVAAPEVIVLKRFGGRPARKLNFNKFNLCKRDDWSCQYCGITLPTSKLTIEHVVPVSRGGKTSWENCVIACKNCNQIKADNTPQEAGMRLKKRPRRPDWNVKLKTPNGVIYDSWKHFLVKEVTRCR